MSVDSCGEEDVREVSLVVNGETFRARVEPRLLLLDLLRDIFGLGGTHAGCEQGVCGACTVILDGVAVRSCLLFGVQVAGREITTIEGLASDGELHPMQEAFSEEHGLQCGFCTPGMILTAVNLLEDDPAPDDEAIRDALSGNICRCTGYVNIVAAVRRAAQRMHR